MKMLSPARVIAIALAFCLSGAAFGATAKKKRHTASPTASAGRKGAVKSGARTASAKRSARTRTVASLHSKRLMAANHLPVSHATGRRGRLTWSPWTEPTYADSTVGDYIDGEDLTVRRAAVEALGPLNGSVVVADSSTGRILTMVNQKIALKSGFQPCSTIKIVAALAGLSEGLIQQNTLVHLYGRTSMSLTQALAKSNNPYFATVGEKLGFDRVSYYARLYGLGERAGLGVDGEQTGVLPTTIPGDGLGMMTSFGSGISLTPLQLTALMSAIANGGTLNYLQYPKNQIEVDHFVPRVKRHLDIAQWIPEIKPGMQGAVEYGTARRASYDQPELIMGKTGTCTDEHSPTHLGWFGSFNEVGKTRLVVVVLLTGGRGVSGPAASGVAGGVYRNLSKLNYFQQEHAGVSPVALVSTQICCRVPTN